LADQLEAHLSLPTVELVSGDRGEFSIWVGDVCVARKTLDGYPAEDAVLRAVAEHLR